MRPSTPLVILLFGILIASTAAILFKFAESAGASSIAIAAGRMTIAALILTPIAWGQAGSQIRTVSRRDLGLAIASGILLALHFATWFASLVYTSIASSTALVATIPIFVAIASVLIFRERLPRRMIAGIGIAIIGSLTIGLSDGGGGATGSNPLLGDLLALIGAAAAAGYYLCGRVVRRQVALLPYIWITYSTAALVLLVGALATGAQLAGHPWAAYAAMLGLALGPQLLGHTAFNWSLRYLSATYIAVAALGEPIGSTILALVLLNQQPRPIQLVGGAILLAGIFVATTGEQTAASA